jgi:hypothetical protein
MPGMKAKGMTAEELFQAAMVPSPTTRKKAISGPCEFRFALNA